MISNIHQFEKSIHFEDPSDCLLRILKAHVRCQSYLYRTLDDWEGIFGRVKPLKLKLTKIWYLSPTNKILVCESPQIGTGEGGGQKFWTSNFGQVACSEKMTQHYGDFRLFKYSSFQILSSLQIDIMKLPQALYCTEHVPVS